MDIHKQIAECLEQGRPFVLATLVKTAGSVPRNPGARMLVFPDGAISGTIGGGKFEHTVIADCLSLLKSGAPHSLKSYKLHESGEDALGMLCGGEADVFMESFGARETLYIFGGGHIGLALTGIALGLGFRIVVIDDRPDILAQCKLGVETILTDSQYNDNFPQIDLNSYVVIVTHGHKCDKEVLSKVVKTDCAYIGMIGSSRKVKETFAILESEGVSKDRLSRVHSPIGLDIGAEGPYEIAIAIAAQLIEVKRKQAAKRP